MAAHSAHNYILLGPPGSGKSTQAELFRNAYGLYHFDTGAELRRAAEMESDFGRQVNEIINVRRELVPDRIIYMVLSQVLENVPIDQGVLVDGAPRRISQLDEVLKPLAETGRVLAKVVFLELSEAVSVERISKRFQCEACLTPYVLGNNLDNPISERCKQCGGKIVQRKDDTPEGILKRFQVFEEETLPVIEHFEKQGLLIRINADQEPDKIFKDVLRNAG